ncbi:peptidyl-prolyl cis-trans isomerase [Bacillus sp. REN10]|uniref:peptidyl-prolyl cis-trans isomerase n=1 Tax=Bacillus sp. REN10 TaxID=2782541 RepID=UPI00193B40C1|nr:peptidyl-prolyl cis-trans isomerase [Bacillus sp. REN10]
MENIMPIYGKVKFSVTLDPGVWIFDDRRIDLDTYFDTKETNTLSEDEEYTKNISQFWDKEIREGAISPPTIKSEKKFLKEQALTGSFAIPFEPFLKNAEPNEEATLIIIETTNGEEPFPLHRANDLLLAFSKRGKPLRDDGPVHLLYKDGSNRENPIRHVKAFRIE